jgi:hypothetical protein
MVNINGDSRNVNKEEGMSVEIENMMPDSSYITFEQMNTIVDFRRLWVDFSIWMRSMLISVFSNHGNLSAVINRLYSVVPMNFHNTLSVFYGPELSEHFLSLIAKFIQIAWRLAEAEKIGDTATASASIIEWYNNAEEIATFLARLNPYWDQDHWKKLLYLYIRMTIEQMKAMAKGDYERDIVVFDRTVHQALLLASYMARGIIARSRFNNNQS